MSFYNLTVNSTLIDSISTTPSSINEESEILLIILLVIGAITAIVILCAIGIFIDCIHQSPNVKTPLRKKRLHVRVLHFPHETSNNDDEKTLTSNMYSTAINELETSTTIINL